MTLAMKIVPRFPARVDGSGPITVTKENGVYTIAYDISGLAAFDLDDATTSFITIYDADTGTFGKLTIQALIDEIGTNLDPVLASLIGASDGILVKSGSDIESRTITAPAAGITVSNGDGVAGDPTLALANDLAAVEGLATTGLVRRTGSDAWSAGTQVATAEVADDAITYAKLQNVSATDKLLARVSSGAGNVEEVDFTDFAQSMSAAAAASDARTLLGLTSPATTTPAALTKTDDTNVTLTLGGTPNTALLQATSITVGWTGTLGAARLNGNVVQGVTNDTNVTGSISTQTLTLGWTGTLAVARGGTGASTESGARTALGLAIGTDVQAYSARLTTVAGYTPTKGKLLVGDGTNWNELPVGTNDYVLTADSIQSLGMLWKAAPGSGGGLSDAYDQFTDGTNVADATGGDTFKFRAGTGVTVTVQSNDGTHGDNLLIGLSANGVSDATLRQSAALSVIGRSANSTGDVADIAAANDGEVLRRSGTSLGFGQIATAGLVDNAITYAKLQDISSSSRILGRKTSGAGDPEEVTLSELLDFIGSAAQGDILYRGASSWARLPAGTNGHFLKAQGAGADPAWAAPAVGGLSLITSSTIGSPVAYLEFSLDFTTYSMFKLVAVGASASGTTDSFNLRPYDGATALGAAWNIFNTVTSSSFYSFDAEIFFNGASPQALWTYAKGMSASSANVVAALTAGSSTTSFGALASVPDRIRFYTGSNNIDAGDFYLYGLKRS